MMPAPLGATAILDSSSSRSPSFLGDRCGDRRRKPRTVGVSDRHCHRPLGLRSVVDVDRKDDIREFLVSRRAKISPEQAGIPRYGELRRVPGLRREEVAQLAGVSTDYYTRLERGSLRGVSDAVLDAVASALQLDDAERAQIEVAHGVRIMNKPYSITEATGLIAEMLKEENSPALNLVAAH